MTSWILYTYKAGKGGKLAQMIPDVRSLRIQKHVWFKPCRKAIHFCLTYHTSLHVLHVTCTNYMYIYTLYIYIISHHVQNIYIYIYIHPTFTTVPHMMIPIHLQFFFADMPWCLVTGECQVKACCSVFGSRKWLKGRANYMYVPRAQMTSIFEGHHTIGTYVSFIFRGYNHL